MGVRTFIALELSEPAKAGILSVIQAFRLRGVRASWARSSTIHLTLRFLGDLEEPDLRRVAATVADVAITVAPFTMWTKGLGAFPSPRRPRVLWAGIEAADELYELQSAIETALAELGFDRERRRFHPHITLGRIRDDAPDLAALLAELAVPEEPTAVGSVRVMKSRLRSSGATHDVVSEFALEGP